MGESTPRWSLCWIFVNVCSISSILLRKIPFPSWSCSIFAIWSASWCVKSSEFPTKSWKPRSPPFLSVLVERSSSNKHSSRALPQILHRSVQPLLFPHTKLPIGPQNWRTRSMEILIWPWDSPSLYSLPGKIFFLDQFASKKDWYSTFWRVWTFVRIRSGVREPGTAPNSCDRRRRCKTKQIKSNSEWVTSTIHKCINPNDKQTNLPGLQTTKRQICNPGRYHCYKQKFWNFEPINQNSNCEMNSTIAFCSWPFSWLPWSGRIASTIDLPSLKAQLFCPQKFRGSKCLVLVKTILVWPSLAQPNQSCSGFWTCVSLMLSCNEGRDVVGAWKWRAALGSFGCGSAHDDVCRNDDAFCNYWEQRQ